MRIVWYLAHYHDIKISDTTVSRMLKRNGVTRLPHGNRLQKVHTKRYNKRVPGHHIQMDVKLLTFKGKRGQTVRRFQFMAIDATRVHALKIYEKHAQASAIDSADHGIKSCPFRIREIRIDNGHEFRRLRWKDALRRAPRKAVIAQADVPKAPAAAERGRPRCAGRPARQKGNQHIDWD
jgi:hypothetical protein